MAGYRPCKRCRPLELDGQPPWASDLLADVERGPSSRITDSDLRARGIDPTTVRRYFGMTFQAYTRARRLAGAFNQIRERWGHSMPPCSRAGTTRTAGSAMRSSGRSGPPLAGIEPARVCVCPGCEAPSAPSWPGHPMGSACSSSPIGRMLESQFARVRKLFEAPVIPGSNEPLEILQDELMKYFAGSWRRFSVPLTYPGTPVSAAGMGATSHHPLRGDSLI